MPDTHSRHGFDYQTAFSRNIGWVTVDEQALLRTRRVAIAGLGGVGGFHLLALARLGVGRFTLSDFDRFDLENFNRQIGATLGTLGQPKLATLVEMAKDINPEIDVRAFPEGVKSSNVREFLADVDLYVDGLDFFAVAARRETFAACAELGIPAVTAAPLGMGVALLNFLPRRMTFEEYFRLEGQSEGDQLVRFLVGLSPAMLQIGYLVDRSRVNLAEHRGPSTVMACHLCAGVAATEAAKILLRRGNLLAAPWGLHFDAYRGKLKRTWRPGGNRNPIQRLAIAIAGRQLATRDAPAPPMVETANLNTVEQILDLARWAPSGDNTQPWRFEIVSDRHFVVHGFDTRDHCVYDLTGGPSQISIGALLETIRIASTGHRLAARVSRRTELPETRPTFDVYLEPHSVLEPSDLLPCIVRRSVQRRPMKTRPLTALEKVALEGSLGQGYEIVWLESLRERMRIAALLFASAKIRLTIPEAYEVHRAVIEWNARFSVSGIPDRAVGLDPLTMRLMQWVMQDWRRVEFLNRFLAGTMAPRLQLDFLPGLFCAAHVLIVGRENPRGIDGHVAAGAAIQRFWLTATKLGLQHQPELTPLIFGGYAREARRFSANAKASKLAVEIAERLDELFGAQIAERAVWLGRVGAGQGSRARSLRLPLSKLVVTRQADIVSAVSRPR